MPPEGVALESRAWLRHGPKGMFGRVEPGLLTAREGRVTFTTREGTVFDADRAEIAVNWPWWEFGAGVHLTASGKIHRFSLARPPQAADWETGLESIPEARVTARAWKNYFN